MSGELRVGESLARGFGVWFKNLPAFTVLAALVYSPVIVYTAVTLSKTLSEESVTRWGLITTLVQTPLNLIVTGAVLFGTVEQLRGRHVGIGESVGVGIKRMLPVLGVGILSTICVALATLALIIPGIIVACMLYVAVPAAVVEKPGIVGALKRSRELTADSRVAIFGVLLVIGALGWVVRKIMESILLGDNASIGDVKAFLWVTVGVSLVLASLSAVINGVVYHDLRQAKEGVATEDLARVFE